MLQCIIVDDEIPALDLLEDNIRQLSFLHLVKKCKSAFEAIEVIQNNKIDLVFSDIQMPGFSGTQLIKSLVNKPMFIFVTAYDHYAIDGFELDVVDYLLKPVSYDRFVKACNKALELYQLKNVNNVIEKNNQKHIFLQVDYCLVKVNLNEILFIEGLKDYVKLHTTSGNKQMLVRISMKALEDMLPPQVFVRIHKSYIINTDHVTSVKKRSIVIEKTELPISDYYKQSIDTILKTDR